MESSVSVVQRSRCGWVDFCKYSASVSNNTMPLNDFAALKLCCKVAVNSVCWWKNFWMLSQMLKDIV